MSSGLKSLFLAALLCVLPLSLAGCGSSGPPDFVLSLASNQPSAISLTQGASANIVFNIAALKGSAGSISLTVSGLPTGVGVAPGSATVGIGSPQTFSLSASSTAPITSSPVTLTATGISGNPLDSSSITHTQTVTLSVVAPTTP